MKFASLILAHKNAPQIARLANQLTADGDEAFIHIDRRAAIVFKQTHEMLSANARVMFAPHRFKTFWGSYGFICAIFHLIALALHNSDANYMVLLSSQDIPLKTNSAIKAFLSMNSGKEFIAAHALPEMTYWADSNGGLDRLQYFWLSGNLRRFNRYIHFLQNRTGMKRSIKGMNLYGGCTWFILSRECLSWIMNYLRNNPGYLRRYRLTYCADEIALHTVFMASPYAAGRYAYSGLPADALRYINWDDGPEYPRTLRIEDATRLFLNQDNLFARKFDDHIDREIIELVYRRIV